MAGEPGEAGAGGAAGDSSVIVLPQAILALHYDFDDLTPAHRQGRVGATGTTARSRACRCRSALPDTSAAALSLNGAQKQYVQLPNHILQGKERRLDRFVDQFISGSGLGPLIRFQCGRVRVVLLLAHGLERRHQDVRVALRDAHHGHACARNHDDRHDPDQRVAPRGHRVRQTVLTLLLDGVQQAEQADLSFGRTRSATRLRIGLGARCTPPTPTSPPRSMISACIPAR